MEQIYASLTESLSHNQFFQGGIVLAAISWAFYQLKAWPLLVWSKIKYLATYHVYFDDSNDFYLTFSEWFAETHPQKFKNVEVRFYFNSESDITENAPTRANGHRGSDQDGWSLRWFQYNDSNLLFYRGRLLWVRKERTKLEMAGREMAFINSYSLSGFFAKKAIDALCQELLERKRRAAKRTALRVAVNTEGGYFEWKDVHIVKALTHIFFEQKAELLQDLNAFLERKEFYKEKGINFKRSYLLYGPPGTGKTSIASAIAKHLDHALYVINLASIGEDHDLQRMGTLIQKKSVVLLEDIDCILANREVKSEKLNFSTVLNFLDGLYAPSDCVFVLTTNHPEMLDSALIRKGRADLSLHIDYPTTDDVRAFMQDFYGVDDVQLVAPLGGRASKGMSEVQDICLRNDLREAKREVVKLFYSSNEFSADAPAVMNGAKAITVS